MASNSPSPVSSGWGDYYEEDKYYLTIRSIGLFNGCRYRWQGKADNQMKETDESVKPTEEVAMATEAVTEAHNRSRK